MIFTRIRIKNLFCFEDTEIDLTYPKRISDSVIENEYLDRRPNFRFKRLCIISGANASGKSSFGRVLCDISNVIHKGRSFAERRRWAVANEELPAEVEVEFVYPLAEKLQFRTLNLRIDIKASVYYFKYAECPINLQDSVESCRRKIDNLFETKKSRGKYLYLENLDLDDYHKKWDKLHELLHVESDPIVWLYDIADIDDTGLRSVYIDRGHKGYTDVLRRVLRTFDPSIQKVTELFEEGDPNNVTGYRIHFPNKKRCGMNEKGELDKESSHLFSRGTHQAISVAGFTHNLIKQMSYKDDEGNYQASGIFFLDEQMSYSHTDLEREIVNLLAQKTNAYSQFFYTTHNYDIFEMGFPLHSFVFIKRENGGNPEFIWANSVCNKNDRNILTFVKNNYFNTIPDVSLLDEILWE